MKRASMTFLASMLVATGALAATYVRVEKDGSKTYSDRPLPGGHPVDLQPAQTYSAPQPTPVPSGNTPGEQRGVLEAASFKYQCSLSPANEQTFQNPESVTLSVALTPSLRMGDQVQFTLNGTAVPAGDNPTSATVSFPDRGTQTASVRVT